MYRLQSTNNMINVVEYLTEGAETGKVLVVKHVLSNGETIKQNPSKTFCQP